MKNPFFSCIPLCRINALVCIQRADKTPLLRMFPLTYTPYLLFFHHIVVCFHVCYAKPHSFATTRCLHSWSCSKEAVLHFCLAARYWLSLYSALRPSPNCFTWGGKSLEAVFVTLFAFRQRVDSDVPIGKERQTSAYQKSRPVETYRTDDTCGACLYCFCFVGFNLPPL